MKSNVRAHGPSRGRALAAIVGAIVGCAALAAACAPSGYGDTEMPLVAPAGSADAPLELDPVRASPARPPASRHEVPPPPPASPADAAPASPAQPPAPRTAPPPGADTAPASPSVRLTAVERRMAEYVDEHTAEAVDFLSRIVEVNSGTMNHEGVREVGRMFEAELAGLGFETRWIPLPASANRAGHLFAERDGGDGRRVLLIGHLDTVFEKDSPFQHFEILENGWARGPGVADMKGGDVVILYALKALAAAGALEGARIVVALLGDEEAPGRPLSTSRKHLIEAAARSDAALGFEGGVGGMNSATIARRGFTGWRLEVKGKTAHSSQIFREEVGAGAIYETARILSAFYDELRGEPYLTLGAGIVLGGTDVTYDEEHDRGTAFGKNNVVPQRVVAAGDLRTLSAEQLASAKRRMQAIVAESLPGTRAAIRFRDSYPPMAPTEANRALFEELDHVSRDLGYGPIEPVDPGLRGAADISFAAQETAALGGLGVVGKGAHSPREVVDLGSIPVMAKRAAVLIHRLTGS